MPAPYGDQAPVTPGPQCLQNKKTPCPSVAQVPSALRRQSRPREVHAHVLPVANRHAGNNDAAAEDIAVAKTRGLRYLFVGADPLRAVDVAIRDPEGELIAHDPVAVIDEIARAARVAARSNPSSRE